MRQRYKSRDYVHEELNQDVTAIAGYYTLTEEIRLPFHGREILYLTGYVVVENSCCGNCNLSYALVPGFIMNWKYKKNKEGLPVSQVEPIRDQAIQSEIRDLIEKEQLVNQVNFI